MIPRLLRQAPRAGFTLVELLISVTIFTLFLAGLVLGTTAFQNLFFAQDNYYQSIDDQMRVLDYIARDVRDAICTNNLLTSCGQVSNNGQTLTVSLPDYINPTTNQPRTPTLTAGPLKSAGNVSYFANSGDSVTVVYAVSGNTITRTQTAVRSGVTTTTATILANNVDSLQLADASQSGSTNFYFGPASMSGTVQFVKTTLTFMPRFTRLNLASSRTGTTLSQTVNVRGN